MDTGSSSGRVMAGLSLHVVEVARADGVELGDVLAAHQVSLEDLRASDAFVPIETHEALWAEGARRTGRADFGLHAASRFPPGLTGAVEYLLRNCATVEDAALTWVRLASVVSNRIEGALVEGGASMRLEWRLDRPLGLGVAHWSEFAQARTLQLMRDALGEPTLAPLEVWVRHEPLGAPEAAARWFGAPLRYGRPCAALVWDRALLARPLQWVDGDARAALEARVARLRARLEADDDATPMGPRVRAALTRALLAPGNDVRLEPIADALALRPRTVQARLARLAREGLAFSALVDAVKSEETQRLLEAGLAASEVARRLGFADASALRKARRRWAQGAGENR